MIPTIKTINESELFIKYKSSYKSAFIDLSFHIICKSSVYYLLWYFRNSWLSICMVPLIGLLSIKTFIIFHDCGHQSYTPNRILNYMIGIILGIFSMTPFSWNFNHNTHHLTNGVVDNMYDHPYNETLFHSLQQYKSFSSVKKIGYKLLRQPYLFVPFVPFLKFLIIMRFNMFRLLNKKLSVDNMKLFIVIEQIINNVGIYGLLYYFYTHNILYHILCSHIISTSGGLMLFHSQHTFNPPYIVNNETYNQKDSGLVGSSFIQIPKYLKYFTGSIEYHHIHHVNSKIPNYNLEKYHNEVVSKSNMFDNIIKLSMMECYNNLWLTLYDEDKKKYITFAEADEEIRKEKK